MQKLTSIRRILGISSGLLTVGLLAIPSFALGNPATTSSGSGSTLTTTEQQQHLADIQQKGDAEINRRLGQLNKLDGIIAAATHLTPSDQAYLTAEVNAEVSGLTALETKLNAETTLSAAIADAQNIFTEYRVYALVTPKVWLVKTADDQQSVEAKLSTLSGKLQSRITADQNAGKNVTSLQGTLNSMNTQISDAQSISSSVEATVLPLQPADYDTDHSILSGYRSKLQTAQSDDQTADSDATTIVTGLKSL